MRQRRTRRAGFSLLELMVSVAIIGILATIAIPSFQRLQLRSRVGEARTNLSSIRDAEEAYFSEFNTYFAAALTPAMLPGADRLAWPAGTDFDVIGWRPDGAVQFQYQVTAPAGGGAAQVYTLEAFSDLDADGVLNAFGLVKEHAGGGAEVAGTVCPDTGVWDPALGLNSLLSTVGPCDSLSGLSVF